MGALIRALSLCLFCLASFCFGAASYQNPATKLSVKNVSELTEALSHANKQGSMQILLADGLYQLGDTLYINADNIALRSVSGDPKRVVIQGTAMAENASVGNLIRVASKQFVLDGITLRKAGNHLIQIAGENDADGVHIRNCILQDAHQQIIKVSYADNGISGDNGIVENCVFEYTAGIGPQWYIGGIDAHAAKNWLIRNNTFKNIASPSQQVAEYAVHFWNGSENNTVKDNTILNCDRGIGFGMKGKPNKGGVISGNRIEHADNGHPFADVGIALDDSSNSSVYGNTVILMHRFGWSIEYRWPTSKGNEIYQNTVNRRILSRNGGQSKVFDNIEK